MKQRHTPLRLQLTLGFSVLLSLLFLLAFLAVYQDTKSSLLQNLDRDLLSLARTELSSAVDGPNQGPHFHGDSGAQQGVLFQPDGLILATTSRLSSDQAQQMVQLGRLHPGPEAFQTAGGYRAVILDAHLAVLPQSRLVLRLPLEPLWRNLGEVRFTLLWWGIACTLFGALVAWALAVRLTRPLERVASLAERVSGGQLGQRLRLSSESSEVHLLQKSLNQMLDELEARAHQQRQFVADASHELRNPLHALQGTLEVARRRPRSAEEYEEAIDVALTETQRLTRLVHDLLVLSRSDLERLEVKREPVELLRLLEDCRQAHQARATELRVDLQLQGKARTVALDPTRIRQVVDNLVDNALRHSPAEATVEIRLGEQEGAPLIEVLDRGISLQPEEYEQIFARFTRLDSSRQRHSGGLGLGLAIARSLVKAHGGQLLAEARPGGGSRFYFFLPARV